MSTPPFVIVEAIYGVIGHSVALLADAGHNFGDVLGLGAAWLASALTTVSMAALGLGVDVRVVARAGLRVSLAVTVSLILLGAMSLGLILGLRVL